MHDVDWWCLGRRTTPKRSTELFCFSRTRRNKLRPSRGRNQTQKPSSDPLSMELKWLLIFSHAGLRRSSSNQGESDYSNTWSAQTNWIVCRNVYGRMQWPLTKWIRFSKIETRELYLGIRSPTLILLWHGVLREDCHLETLRTVLEVTIQLSFVLTTS